MYKFVQCARSRMKDKSKYSETFHSDFIIKWTFHTLLSCLFQSERSPLDAGIKLAITMRFMATGNSYHSLSFALRVAHNTISLFVPRVCQAICHVYKDEVFKIPSTPDGWRVIEDHFRRWWNFPHVCGALDGKHIAIRKTPKVGVHITTTRDFSPLSSRV